MSEALREEMEARGWTDWDIESRIPDPIDRAAALMIIHVDDKKLILDDRTAEALAKAFDVSVKFIKGIYNYPN